MRLAREEAQKRNQFCGPKPTLERMLKDLGSREGRKAELKAHKKIPTGSRHIEKKSTRK